MTTHCGMLNGCCRGVSSVAIAVRLSRSLVLITEHVSTLFLFFSGADSGGALLKCHPNGDDKELCNELRGR